MSLKKHIGKAVALFESFREAKPRRIGVVKLAVPPAVAVMGYVEGIDYRTTHGGKVTLYHHDFEPGSRPLLAVSPDGRQLLLLGGRYEWTEQGIVDKDARGNLITNPQHGRNINPSGRLKQVEVFKQIRSLGLTVKRDEAGEFRVTVKSGDAELDEAIAYYTDDLGDALSTAGDIARRWADDPRNRARVVNPKKRRAPRSEHHANRELVRGARKPDDYYTHNEKRTRKRNPAGGKVLSAILNDPRVKTVSDERSDGGGVWVYLKPGYVSRSTDTGSIHEDSWSAAHRVLRQQTAIAE